MVECNRWWEATPGGVSFALLSLTTASSCSSLTICPIHSLSIHPITHLLLLCRDSSLNGHCGRRIMSSRTLVLPPSSSLPVMVHHASQSVLTASAAAVHGSRHRPSPHLRPSIISGSSSSSSLPHVVPQQQQQQRQLSVHHDDDDYGYGGRLVPDHVAGQKKRTDGSVRSLATHSIHEDDDKSQLMHHLNLIPVHPVSVSVSNGQPTLVYPPHQSVSIMKRHQESYDSKEPDEPMMGSVVCRSLLDQRIDRLIQWKRNKRIQREIDDDNMMIICDHDDDDDDDDEEENDDVIFSSASSAFSSSSSSSLSSSSSSCGEMSDSESMFLQSNDHQKQPSHVIHRHKNKNKNKGEEEQVMKQRHAIPTSSSSCSSSEGEDGEWNVHRENNKNSSKRKRRKTVKDENRKKRKAHLMPSHETSIQRRIMTRRQSSLLLMEQSGSQDGSVTEQEQQPVVTTQSTFLSPLNLIPLCEAQDLRFKKFLKERIYYEFLPNHKQTTTDVVVRKKDEQTQRNQDLIPPMIPASESKVEFFSSILNLKAVNPLNDGLIFESDQKIKETSWNQILSFRHLKHQQNNLTKHQMDHWINFYSHKQSHRRECWSQEVHAKASTVANALQSLHQEIMTSSSSSSNQHEDAVTSLECMMSSFDSFCQKFSTLR